MSIPSFDHREIDYGGPSNMEACDWGRTASKAWSSALIGASETDDCPHGASRRWLCARRADAHSTSPSTTWLAVRCHARTAIGRRPHDDMQRVSSQKTHSCQ